MLIDLNLDLAHAETIVPEERWEGYRSATSPEVQNLNLPFQAFAENAVLEMETVGMTQTPGERFEFVNVANEPVVTDPDLLSSNVRLLQIETCRKQNLAICPVLGYSNKATTFFNRGRFVGCRHNFHNWISLASQVNGDRSVRTISPPIILRNAKQEVLYNSAFSGKPQIQFSTINDDPRLNFQTQDTEYPSSEVARPVAQADYVEMTLNESIVREYAVTERTSGTNNLRPNEETYLLGYPGRTNSFPNGLGDAPGRTLVVSNGRALDAFHDFSLLQTSNFMTGGASGGPMVTATGELAGVNCRFVPAANPVNARTYPMPIGSNVARNYWRSIPYASEAQLADAAADIEKSMSVNP